MTFRSNENPMFRSKFSEDIFRLKYLHEDCETWGQLCRVLVEDVCGKHLSDGDKTQLCQYMTDLKVIAGGRYLYYAGREAKFWNNCFLLKAEEDTREDWATMSWKSESCLMIGSLPVGVGRTLPGRTGFQQPAGQGRQEQDGAEHVHQEHESQQDPHVGLKLER